MIYPDVSVEEWCRRRQIEVRTVCEHAVTDYRPFLMSLGAGIECAVCGDTIFTMSHEKFEELIGDDND